MLPQAGLSWHAVTEAIRTDIFSHEDDYKALLLAKKDSSLLVQEIGFVSDNAGSTPKQPRVTVTFDYLEVEADILARSEEHTSELQSLMRHSYAVSCLKKKKKRNRTQ